MERWAEIDRLSRFGLAALSLLLSLWASGHAVVYKRDPRAATLWVGVIWILPLGGALLYFLFGINRIRRWAESLRGGLPKVPSGTSDRLRVSPVGSDDPTWTPPHLGGLARAIDEVSVRPLVRGNEVEPLIDGDAAFPAMLEAIGNARTSIALATYIFDADEVGLEFARALGAAVRRGVAVRVLVDATGVRYSWPSIVGALRREKVPEARFLRLFPVWRLLAMNLRNHRKILVVDGHTGFTGGMNLRAGHWRGRQPARPVQDIHFRVKGPVVAHLQAVFAEDWRFTTGEILDGPTWFPELTATGPVIARGISDGPDEDLDTLRWTLLAALAAARTSVRIATPYFLPEAALIAALNVAALRGVEVDIVLPSRSNLPLVHEASRAHWWQILEHGCRVWLSDPPFDHSKLFLVDDAWALVGSANWDPRSLRLNFEFNLECHDAALAARLADLFTEKLRHARQVTLEEVDGRRLPARLRDGIARLFTPIL